jgi:hypothetical protein
MIEHTETIPRLTQVEQMQQALLGKEPPEPCPVCGHAEWHLCSWCGRPIVALEIAVQLNNESWYHSDCCFAHRNYRIGDDY